MSDLGRGLLGLLVFIVAVLWMFASGKSNGGKKFLIFGAALLFPDYTFADLRVDMPSLVRQGSHLRIDIEDPDGVVGGFVATFYGERFRDYISFPHDLENRHAVLIPVGVSEPPSTVKVSVFGAFEIWSGQIEVVKTDFPESDKIFHVSKPSSEVEARRRREQDFLDGIYSSETQTRFFSEPLRFANPLRNMEAVPNTEFGTIRKKVLVNPKTRKIEARWRDYHKGIDLKAIAGVPVFAAESGRVAAARNLLGSGNTIIIDHGYGLLSLYFHLSKIFFKEGKEVRKGQKIGLAGRSGNAEGPHLHFELRLHGIPVNPLEFLQGGAK